MAQDTEPDHWSRINALPAEYFRPLLECLPRPRSAPVPHSEEELAHPMMVFSDPAEKPICSIPGNTKQVDMFISLCYELDLVIPHDRHAFMQAHPFHEQPGVIDAVDPYPCGQALTAFLRADRFPEGTVAKAWSTGSLGSIIGRLSFLLSKRMAGISQEPLQHHRPCILPHPPLLIEDLHIPNGATMIA